MVNMTILGSNNTIVDMLFEIQEILLYDSNHIRLASDLMGALYIMFENHVRSWPLLKTSYYSRGYMSRYLCIHVYSVFKCMFNVSIREYFSVLLYVYVIRQCSNQYPFCALAYTRTCLVQCTPRASDLVRIHMNAYFSFQTYPVASILQPFDQKVEGRMFHWQITFVYPVRSYEGTTSLEPLIRLRRCWFFISCYAAGRLQVS